MSKKQTKKVRVNITVDKATLEKAKTKLNLFGGKISTLFNAYLSDFVASMQDPPAKTHEGINKRLEELEKKVKKLEGN